MREKTRTDTDEHGQTQEDIKKRDVYVRGSPCKSVSEKRMTKEQFTATCAANGALSLLNLCIYLVDRQMKAQADAFEKEGGFTERLYRVRTQKRKMN